MKMVLKLMATTGLVAATTPAFAQTATPTGDPVADAKVIADRDDADTTTGNANDVVVTGTRIVRPNNKSAAPITTVTRAEIEAQGATTIEEVLNRLPQIQPNAEQNYADSNGRQRIKLRSLGFERTLTLVDGLRLGQRNEQDVSIIPSSLVERVDILSGGASSVYGSDAVSGVVNFILKKNFDGIAIDGGYSLYNHHDRANAVTDAARAANLPSPLGWTNDGARVNVTASFGKNLFDNAVNITGFVNYRHSDILPLADRSYSACEVLQSGPGAPLTCSLATYTAAGSITPQTGPNANRRVVNNPNGDGTFVGINSGPGTAANPYDGFSFQRQFNRINTGGFVTARLSSDIELYSTALFYRDRSRNPQLNRAEGFASFGATPYQLNCNNPFLSASQAQFICGARAGTADRVPIDVRYRFDNLPPLDNFYENKGYRITGGLRGRVLNDVWSYDIAGVYANTQTLSRFRALSDFDRVSRSLLVVNRNGVPTCQSVIDGTDPNCVPFNAFRPGNADQALSNYILYSPFGSSKTNPIMFQAITSLSGDLGKYGITSPFAEQGIAVAFGAEYRSEIYKTVADEAFRETSGGQDGRFTQNVTEVNTEVQVPLVEDKSWTKLLQVNGGFRASRYNRLNGVFKTWKVEGLWAPVEDITFRGAFNRAAAAPTVTQAASASDINYTTIGSRNDPCASVPTPTADNPNAVTRPTATLVQCRNTGLPDDLYGSTKLSCPDQSCTIRNGGFGLTPETANTKTFGVILRPRFLPGLTISIDRFLIDLDRAIDYYPAANFLDNCLATGLDFYCRGVVRNPGTFTLSSPAAGNPTTGYLAQGLTNTYKSKSHGWDFQAQYNLGLGAVGKLDFSFNGSLTTMVGSQDAPDLPKKNCVGYFGKFCGESLPRWTHGLRTTYTSPDNVFHLSVNWRHISSQTSTSNVSDPDLGIPVDKTLFNEEYGRIKPYDYIDLSTSFDVTKQFSLRLAVNNVFDRDPPLLPNSRNLLGLLRSNTLFRYDLLGRQLVAGASIRF